MEEGKKNKLMQELSLLLMFLFSWEEKDITGSVVHRAWKGYDFNILDQLKEEGLIDFSYKAKSLHLSDEGVQKAKILWEKFVSSLEQHHIHGFYFYIATHCFDNTLKFTNS